MLRGFKSSQALQKIGGVKRKSCDNDERSFSPKHLIFFSIEMHFTLTDVSFFFNLRKLKHIFHEN